MHLRYMWFKKHPEHPRAKWEVETWETHLRNAEGVIKEALKPDPVAIRHDDDKPMHDLISPWALEELAKVCTKGKVEYGKHNWTLGLTYARCYNSLIRHLNSMRKGERYDSKSGLLHSSHALWNAMALSHFDATNQYDLNDLNWGPLGQPIGQGSDRSSHVGYAVADPRSTGIPPNGSLTGTVDDRPHPTKR